jgi:hypothetical protein
VSIEYLRSFKIFSIAIFDLVSSYIVMYILGTFFNLNVKKLMLAVIPLSLIIHKVIGLDTQLIKSVYSPKNLRDYIIVLLVFINDIFLFYY